MQITFLGQSGFLIETSSKRIGIDIRLDNPVKPLHLSDIPKLDYSCCTHDHGDHGFDTMIALAKRDNALFLSGYEMMNVAKDQGCRTEQASVGGLFAVDEYLDLALTPAIHTSNTGIPVGFVFKIAGRTIYHMGDTAFMTDFTMIRDVYAPDIVMIPIGSRYTMGPKEAGYALDTLMPKIAIPMHYNTFQKIEQDPNILKNHMKTHRTQISIMEVGSTITI